MKKMMLLIAVMMSFLTSCVPIAIIGVVGASAVIGGSIIYDQRPFKVILQDRAIVSRAQSLINEDPQLQGRSHISVYSFNRVALLVGQAQTPELRARAYQIVSSVEYVQKVYNQIVISGVTTDLSRTDDAWITGKVKSAMLGQKGLHSSQIKVITENGVVYLMGLVTRSQADLAVNSARRVEGVQKVVKVFQYQN